MKKINKFYVSEIDQHLAKFDRTHAKSPAQQAEIDKYQHISQLRDHPTPPTLLPQDDIWKDF